MGQTKMWYLDRHGWVWLKGLFQCWMTLWCISTIPTNGHPTYILQSIATDYQWTKEKFKRCWWRVSVIFTYRVMPGSLVDSMVAAAAHHLSCPKLSSQICQTQLRILASFQIGNGAVTAAHLTAQEPMWPANFML